MKLQEKLKICTMAIDKKKYNAIKFDFEKNLIVSTNGNILLKINHVFDKDNSALLEPENQKSIIFHAIYLEELNKHLDLSHNLFQVLQQHLGVYQYSNYFPDVDRISFYNTQSVNNISYNTKTLLSVIKICEKLTMQNIEFNFNDVKNPTQIKNDIAEIIFMPKI